VVTRAGLRPRPCRVLNKKVCHDGCQIHARSLACGSSVRGPLFSVGVLGLIIMAVAGA
jgi:hypothetical protein